jgi:deoxyribodipyrimidine photolyase-related protein
MVTGLFALLLGVEPRQVHEWYLAVYVDAVEWVELPNTLGMSQYADGGSWRASRTWPAGSTSPHEQPLRRLPLPPGRARGPRACPFTTLYWDFLDGTRRASAIIRGSRCR